MADTGAAHDWDDVYAAGSPPPWDIGRPQHAFLRLAAAGALAGTLLDVGCGTGEHAILAARGGARAVGVDLSARAVELARRKAEAAGLTVEFHVLDARRVEELGVVFDVVCDSGLFHVFDDDDRARYVAALAAALRPGGHLNLMCFSERQPGDWGPRRVTEAELRAAFGRGWRMDALSRDQFELSLDPGQGVGVPHAEAWLADVVRLSPGS